MYGSHPLYHHQPSLTVIQTSSHSAEEPVNYISLNNSPKPKQHIGLSSKNRPPWGKYCSITHSAALSSLSRPVSLTLFVYVVRKRFISTSSLSATSTPASRPPPVGYTLSADITVDAHVLLGHLIYKCGGIDKRTIEKFEKVRLRCSPAVLLYLYYHCLCFRIFLCWWGTVAPRLCARLKILDKPYPQTFLFALLLGRQRYILATYTDNFYRKPPSWARVPSSMLGFLTN